MLDFPENPRHPKLEFDDIGLLDLLAVFTVGVFRANLSNGEDSKKLNGAISLNCIFEVGDEKSSADEKSARQGTFITLGYG